VARSDMGGRRTITAATRTDLGLRVGMCASQLAYPRLQTSLTL
jgi:hypothetical protein